MNYDYAIPERIYDPVEEERRIREGEIAKSMLEKNMDIELISELTNL